MSKRIHSLTLLATILDSSDLEVNVQSGEHNVYESDGSEGSYVSATMIGYSPEELANAKSDLKWMKEQQELRAHESSGKIIEFLQLVFKGFENLDSINLDAAVIVSRTRRELAEYGRWHPLWLRASHLFSLVLTAMVQSGVSVKTLDVYRDTPRCCIPSGHITTYAAGFNPNQLEVLSKDLESLKLSMSTEIENERVIVESDGEELGDHEKAFRDLFGHSSGHLARINPRALLTDGKPGITSLLQSALALRQLDLSFRQALKYGTLKSYDRIIESIAAETNFPRLETCALSGFMAKGKSILLFFEKHPNLRSVTLHEFELTIGSWTPIFAHLSHSMPMLESLSLSGLSGRHISVPKQVKMDPAPGKTSGSDSDSSDDPDASHESHGKLYDDHEVNGMVNLHPIWDTEERSLETSFSTFDTYFVHTRSFNHEELKKGLLFHPNPSSRAKGSPELMYWRKSRRELYGLP
jgi:hypothetical protein